MFEFKVCVGGRIRKAVVVGGEGGRRAGILSLPINAFLLVSSSVQCCEGGACHISLKICNFGKHGTTS